MGAPILIVHGGAFDDAGFPSPEEVVAALFPDAEDDGPLPGDQGFRVTILRITEITGQELAETIKKLRAKKTAPGPDGIPSRVCLLVSNILDPPAAIHSSLERGGSPPDGRRAG